MGTLRTIWREVRTTHRAKQFSPLAFKKHKELQRDGQLIIESNFPQITFEAYEMFAVVPLTGVGAGTNWKLIDDHIINLGRVKCNI
jgi:hypothetical protein